MYDNQIGRMNMQDRFADKYNWMSPYQYAANNPLRYIDINGDSLQVTDKSENKANTAAFKEETDKGLGGFYNTNVDDDGNVTLEKTDQKGKMTKQQKNSYKSLNKIISNKKTTSVEIVNNDPTVEIGSFDTGQIDIGDMKNLNSSNLEHPEFISTQGAIAHELTKQFQKQVNGITDRDIAHGIAIQTENLVNGSNRIDVGTFQVNDKQGNPYGYSLRSLTTIGTVQKQIDIVIKNGNVVGLIDAVVH